MVGRRRQQATSYFRPGAGWGDEQEGATLRLRARLSGQVTSVVENVLEEPGPEGWRPLTNERESRLGAPERGLVWYGWHSALEGEPYLMLRGVRAIDQLLASTLLDGIVVFDHDGRELDDATIAGLRFAVRGPDAGVFAGRVKEAGGHILPVPADLGELRRHSRVLAVSADQLEEIAAWSRSVIEAGAQGITLDLHRIGERAEEAWEQHRAARRALASLAPAQEAFQAAGRALDEQVAAERLVAQASAHARRVEDAFALYRGCEREAVRLLAAHGLEDGMDQHLALIEDEGADSEILGQLAARLLANGTPARLEAGALVVGIPGGEVVISAREVSLRRQSAA